MRSLCGNLLGAGGGRLLGLQASFLDTCLTLQIPRIAGSDLTSKSVHSFTSSQYYGPSKDKHGGITCTAASRAFSGAQQWRKIGRPAVEVPFAVRGLATGVPPSGGETSSNPHVASAGVEVQTAKDAKKGALAQKGIDTEDSEYWGIQPKTYTREDGSVWPWHSFRPHDCYASNVEIDADKHFKPKNIGDTFAYYLVKSLRLPTDLFFQKRYGCRAMMLETVAAVPGMVGGMLLHLKSLRRFEHTGGWIRALLDEAENERMHLMTFMEFTQPKWYERLLVLAVQGIFFNVYFVAYLLSPRVAHRVVGYLEEEAVWSYTEFIKQIDKGKIPNGPAPAIAIDYWRLPKDATIRDVCIVVRADEAHHRDVNHFAANVVQSGQHLKDNPAPVDYH